LPASKRRERPDAGPGAGGLSLRPAADTFIERLSWFYGEINVLHPFRLGNGLTQRIFFEQLAIHAGYLLDWRIDPAAWSTACQQGAMGDPTRWRRSFAKW
jgi:cell filamentation protein